MYKYSKSMNDLFISEKKPSILFTGIPHDVSQCHLLSNSENGSTIVCLEKLHVNNKQNHNAITGIKNCLLNLSNDVTCNAIYQH